MPKIILDTNAYSGFLSGNELVFEYLIEAEKIYVSAIVIGELFAGFLGGSKRRENREELKTFLLKPGVEILEVSIETAEIFGHVKNQLRQQGTMIPVNDIWIAAHTIESGAKLITFDKHFMHIPGLRIWEELENR